MARTRVVFRDWSWLFILFLHLFVLAVKAPSGSPLEIGDEITKEVGDFVKCNFGDQVTVVPVSGPFIETPDRCVQEKFRKG